MAHHNHHDMQGISQTHEGSSGDHSLDAVHALDAIDWAAPWLATVAQWGQSLATKIVGGMPVYQALNQQWPAVLRAEGWRFVPQEALPAGMAYERFIREQRCIPTRDNLHDFFNGLIWLCWPQLKLHLNYLQSQAIASEGVKQHRGKLRDAITVLDENGALLLAPPPLVDALRAKDWRRLMVELRPLWAQACLWPVGHALLEKLVQPRKPMCAHVLCLPWDEGGNDLHSAHVPAALDARMAQDLLLSAEVLATKPFSPLPILGVPGWWQPNEDFSFYDDPLVFRSANSKTSLQQRGALQVTMS